MSNLSINKMFLDQVCALARKAGERIMPFYQNAQPAALKADNSPLTAADLASHEFLVAELPKILPNCPVVSEESAPAIQGSANDLPQYWLIDPLDGTKEFLKGTHEFTVNIALITDQKPVLGVVYTPALQSIYFAATDVGVWRQKPNEPSEPIASRRPARTPLVAVASKDHAGPMVKALLEKLPDVTLRSMGSSLKFCLVAEGTADFYLRDVPTMEWDTAAAQCIVETAGGRVYALDGLPLTYGKPGLKNPFIITVGDPDWKWRELTQTPASG